MKRMKETEGRMMIEVLKITFLLLILLTQSIIVFAEDNTPSRPSHPDGPPHTNKLVNLTSANTTRVLIVTEGHGPLTGISPIEEKDFWLGILSEIPDLDVDWYDGIPSFDLLNQYDLVIYDAGGYWYPLDQVVDSLRDYHFTGKPLIVVAPDINYNWWSGVPEFTKDVLHIEGVLGIMPEAVYDIYANTGHEIVYSIPAEVGIGVPAVTSWPDCFDPASDCEGVLTQGYIPETEFGVGSCSDLPSYSPYDPKGELFAVVAYSGSDIEGKVITFGIPISGLENKYTAKQLAKSSILWCLQEKIVDIGLDLRIEDADDNTLVRKAAGDKIDIVAIIKNNEDTSQLIDVEITAPSVLGVPEKVIVRKDFPDHTEISEDEGKTVVTLNLNPGEIRHVVWRFTISNNANPQEVTVSAKIKKGGTDVTFDSQTFRIVKNTKAIIVTNRYLLYKESFGSIDYDDEIKSLLSTLYEVANSVGAVVYYVDHYSEEFKDWDPSNVNYDGDWSNNDLQEEKSLNSIAIKIDGYIEDWVSKLDPKYLLIVGNDRIIPMYRMDDPADQQHCEEFKFGIICKGIREFPEVYKNGYYFTDMPYADLDGNWRKGDIELSVGRIVGAIVGWYQGKVITLKDMEELIRRGINGNNGEVTNAIVATHNEAPQTTSVDELKKKFTVLNEGKLVGKTNKKDTKNELVSTLKNNRYSLFLYSGHGSQWGICFGDKKGTDCIGCVDTPNVFKSTDRPILFFEACEAGNILPNDNIDTNNMVYATIRAGASSVIASTAISVYHKFLSGYAEVLTDEFFKNLFKKDSKYSMPVGDALKKAKEDYSPFFKITWTGKDIKTVTEYQLYGVPWEVIDPPKAESNEDTWEGYTVSRSKPRLVDENTFEIDISVNISQYNIITTEDGYDLIIIPGASYTLNEMEPVIPYITIPLYLPTSANNITIANEKLEKKFIGEYNVPSSRTEIVSLETPSGKTFYSTINFTTETIVSGLYPPFTSSLDIVNNTEHKKVKVLAALSQYNTDTNATYICNLTLTIRYTSATPITITSFDTEKVNYHKGETINFSAFLENIGTDTISVDAKLSLIDEFGETKAFETKSIIIEPGENREILFELDPNLPDGTYLAKLEVFGSGILGASSKYIHIASGEILEFSVPDGVIQGDNIEFGVLFKNDNSVDVSAQSIIYLYDKYGIKVAELTSPSKIVSAGTTSWFNITWNTLGKKIGNYKASAVVLTEESSFGPVSKYFKISPLNQPPIANANGPYAGIEGQPVEFNASLSYDPEGMPLTYYWEFGDGETAVTNQPTITHIYAQEGNYTVTLIVNDSVQNSTPSITYALINDTEPKANFTANITSGFAPLTVQFNDLSTSYDGIIAWEWDFNGDGTIDSNEQNPTHTYDEAGTCLLYTSPSPRD